MRPNLTLSFWLVGVLAVSAQNAKDPYLWLEDVTNEKCLDWVKERNAKTTAELAQSPEFKALDDRLLKILDAKDRIPMISKDGPWYYNFWRDEKNKRGLWRRTTLDEYRKEQPNWEIVLDLDKLAAEEKENWVWGGANFLQPKYERCMISLSRGGADAKVTREFDVTTKSFVKDGFSVPEAKSVVSWKDKDTLYVGTDFSKGTLTTSGYPRITKEWKRGTKLEDAKLVYEGKPDDMRAYAYWDLSPGYEREFASRRIEFYSGETFVRRDGKFVKIDKPDDADVRVHREWLFVTPRTDWKIGNKAYPGGSLLVIDFERFMKGDRNFDVLFEPTARKSLAGFSPTKTKVILNELDNVSNHLYVLTREGGAWKRDELPGAAPLSSVGASAVDSDESDDYFLTGSNYLTPSNLSFGTLGGKPPEKLKSGPSYFDAAGLEVSQHEVASKDGTKIPYFQVGPKGLKCDGTNPTLLYGYGGFEISMTPQYNPTVGAAWLEKGGVYVVANIRGGGEFGPKWHQAALKANRPRAYEDFAAVAEDLIKRKVTTPQHLGTTGGSNGGLLMGNMLTQYPHLFGAIVCQVPLLDMQRYHKLLAGASWMAEYGNPDKPEEWEFIRTFSPYQNVSTSGKYPRTLFTTSTRDDRVHPGHARKMMAKMQEMGHDVLLYENIEGGHGGAADNKQRAFMSALAYTFLWKQVK
ncbi:MAG TPA: prolyl oligopeptidase family serine peptidase [Gemmataceae bacterium]|nr:prolyl oligopeptidase family serine peptidase [Gemmataceae bacterium]